MSGAHIHLLLTHIPVMGIVFGLLVTTYGFVRRRNETLQIGLGAFVFSGLAAIVVYLTGESAEEVVEHLAGVSEAAIEAHEEAAFVALIATLGLGLLSLIGLWLLRKGLPRSLAAATLVVALAVSGVMAWTANLGGKISHPEIRSETSLADTGNAVDHDDYRDEDD